MHTGHTHSGGSSAQDTIFSTVDTLRSIFDALDAPTVNNIFILGDFNEMDPKETIFPYFAMYTCVQGANSIPTIGAHIADYILHMTPHHTRIDQFTTKVRRVLHGSDHRQVYAKVSV